MSDQHSQFEHSQDKPEAGALYRAMADGELSPAQQAAYDAACAHDAQHSNRLEHERQLRAAVGRVLGADSAPAALRMQLKTMFDESPSVDIAASSLRIDRGAPVARSWQRPWWMGMAAGFVLAAGLMMILAPWKSGTPAQHQGTQGNQIAVEGGPYSTTRLVSFLTEQHDRCANLGSFFHDKMQYRTRADAERAAIELLSAVPAVFDLHDGELTQMGYHFEGLGRCQVPGRGKSAHLIYTSNEAGHAPISLWVQQDTGEWDDRVRDAGCTYGVELCRQRGTGMSIWR